MSMQCLVERVLKVSAGDAEARVPNEDLAYTSEQVALVERVLHQTNSSTDILGVDPCSSR